MYNHTTLILVEHLTVTDKLVSLLAVIMLNYYHHMMFTMLTNEVDHPVGTLNR